MAYNPEAASVRALLDTIPEPGAYVPTVELEALLNERNGVTGWSLQAIPKATEAAWEAFLSIVELAEVKIVSLAKNDSVGEDLREAMILVSPIGMKKLARSNEAWRKRERN